MFLETRWISAQICRYPSQPLWKGEHQLSNLLEVPFLCSFHGNNYKRHTRENQHPLSFFHIHFPCSLVTFLFFFKLDFKVLSQSDSGKQSSGLESPDFCGLQGSCNFESGISGLLVVSNVNAMWDGDRSFTYYHTPESWEDKPQNHKKVSHYMPSWSKDILSPDEF